MRQGRSRGGWVRKKEETRQKFAIMSVEEGGRRVQSGRKGVFWVVGEWEGVRAHSCQFKQRHLSGGLLVCVCVCDCDCVRVCAIKRVRG